MQKKIIKIASSKLLQKSFLLMFATFLASAFNYIYHLFAGRWLKAGEFGLFESMIALSYFLYVFAQGINYSIVNRVSSLPKEQISTAIFLLEKKVLRFSWGVFFVLLAFYPFVVNFLHLPSFVHYFVFCAQGFFILLPILYPSILQARLKFAALALLSVIPVVIKLPLTYIFIKIGLGGLGAFLALVGQSIMAGLFGFILVRRYYPKINKQIKQASVNLELKSIMGLAVLTNVSLVSLYSSDILLVKNLFSENYAGIYAAAAVLAKIIFFGATLCILAVYPMFVKYKNNKKRLKQIFFASLTYVTTVSAGGIIFYYYFPENIIRMLYGQGFNQSANLLPAMAVFVSLTAGINLCSQFLLALEKKQALLIPLFTGLVQIILIIVNHNSLNQVIINSIEVCLFGFVISLIFSIYYLVNEKYQINFNYHTRI